MFYYKKLDLIAFSLMASLLFIGCGSGGSGSQNVTSLATYGVTVNSNLLKDGQAYTVEIDSQDNNITIYGACTAVGAECTAKIPTADFMQTSDSVNLRVMQNGSLIAAEILEQPSQYLTTNNNGYVANLDEYSTGEYIVDKLQIMTDDFLPNTYVEDAITEFYNINKNSSDYYLEVPVTAYYMFQAAQGSLSYSIGLYNAWFALYGNPDDFASLNQASTQPSNLVTSLLKVGLTNKTGPVDSGAGGSSGTKPKPDKEYIGSASTNLKGDVLTNITSADSQKAIMALAQRYAASVGIPALSDETKDTLKIVKDVSTIAFKTLDMVYPGLGSLVTAISGGLLDGLIGKPDDPNKPMIEAMGKIEQAVDRVSANLQSIHADNLQIKIAEKTFSTKDARSKIEGYAKDYYLLMKERGIAPLKSDAIKSDFVMATIIDKKLAQKEQEGQAAFDAEVATIKQWFANAEKDNVIGLMGTIGSDENIGLIYTIVNAQMKNEVGTTTDKIKALNSSGVDLDMNSGTNILAAYRGGAKKLLDFQVSLLVSFEKIRSLHLAAAYLKYKSGYKANFGDIKVDIANFSYQGATYKDVVGIINNYYTNTIYKGLTDRIKSRQELLTGKGDITDTTYTGMYKDPRAYFDPAILQTISSTGRSWCNITYWDSKNLGYRCEVGNVGDVIRYKDFYIGNVSGGVCKSRIKQAISSDPAYDHRYYCDTDLQWTYKNKVNNDTIFSWDNDMKDAWIKVSSGDSVLYRGPTASDKRRAFFYTDVPDNAPGITFNVSNGRIMDRANTTSSASALYKTFVETIDFSWKKAGMNLTGAGMAVGNGGAITDMRRAMAQMDVTETYKGTRNYSIFAVWDRFNGQIFKENGSTAYSTLGCTTSDCTLVKSTNSEVKIAFDSGWTVSMKPFNLFSFAGLTTLSRTQEKESQLRPAGDWEQYCKDKAPIIVRNGWIKAKCGNINNVGVNDQWSFLNYKQCALGSEVTLNSANQLVCK